MALEIDLQGKVAIVTGASSGIGFGIATMLAKAGCHLATFAIDDKNSDNVKELNTKLGEFEIPHFYQKVDVTKVDELKQFVNNVIEKFNQIDILVSNAGANIFEKPEECSQEKWQQNIDLNLASHWNLSKLCKPYLSKSDNGTIIIMSSNHAFATLKNCFPYNVTKTALNGLVKTLALDWGSEIRTVGIAPCFIDNKNAENWFNSFENPEEKRKKILEIHPVKRFGAPEEIGAFCVFLASDFAKFITGVTYLVDGGRSTIMQDV